MLSLYTVLVGIQLTMKREVDTLVMGKRCWGLRDRQDGIAMSLIHWKVYCVTYHVASPIYCLVIDLKKPHARSLLPDGQFRVAGILDQRAHAPADPFCAGPSRALPCRRPPSRPQHAAAAPRAWPPARQSAVQRNFRWGWTGVSEWGRVAPQACSGGTASERLT